MPIKSKKINFPATCVVNWPTGPVPCCDKHAHVLITLSTMLGHYVVKTTLNEAEECSNCVNGRENHE